MSYYSEAPGLYTNQINPFPFTDGVNWPYLASIGYEWVSFQVYNPAESYGIMDFDLNAVKAHGFKNVGVWGVFYDTVDFFNGGKALGAQAVKLHADHCIANAEMCMKNTKIGRLAQPLIKGIRAGGWTGSVDLSTLGAPWNPSVNDYGMDLQSFLETGGTIHSQDYLNDSEGYHPKFAVEYYKHLGIPESKINHTIALYSGTRGKITGTQWVTVLDEADVDKNISIYMVQDGQKVDYEGLRQVTTSIQVKALDSTRTKEAMIALANAWLDKEEAESRPQSKSRIREAKRILSSSDLQFKKCRDTIYNALNNAGVNQ